MDGTMAACRHYNSLLNRHANWLTGPSASFFNYYWGANPDLNSNRLHKHNFLEVCYVVDGYGTYFEQGVRYPLEKGTLFCSRPGVFHQIQSVSNLFLLWVAFELIEQDSSAATVNHFQKLSTTDFFLIKNADRTPTACIWRSLWAQAEQFHPEFIELMSGLACSLLSSFPQLFNCEMNTWNKSESESNMTSVLMNQAKLYIHDNLSNSLKLEEVADYLHISGRHLTRMFKQENTSFSDYVRRMRLSKAKFLIARSDTSLKQIADECGFANIHYFTRVFIEQMGISPGKFRKQSTL
jgi:AraC-like DNA-binding protein